MKVKCEFPEALVWDTEDGLAVFCWNERQVEACVEMVYAMVGLAVLGRGLQDGE